MQQQPAAAWQEKEGGPRGAACANETLKLADAAQRSARSLNEIAKFLCLFYAGGKLKKKRKSKVEKRKRKMMRQPCLMFGFRDTLAIFARRCRAGRGGGGRAGGVKQIGKACNEMKCAAEANKEREMWSTHTQSSTERERERELAGE